MNRPLLLDLFCGAGGAAMGYRRAGFDVIGVDINDQPNYPFEFHQGDALAVLQSMIVVPRWLWNRPVAAVHASPPCQHFTAYRRHRKDITNRYAELIAPTREALAATGLPYVIENVPGAPLRNPITLCGSMFGLDVRRHRLFESNVPMLAPQCDHGVWTERKYPGATNRTNGRYTAEIGVWRIPLEEQKAAMGIDWDISLRMLSEAIPPAYTEWIGQQLIAQIRQEAA